MKIKVMALLTMAGLLLLAVWAYKKDYQDLWLVIPDGYGMAISDLRGIEKISGDEITATYEMKKLAAAESAGIQQPVTLIETNAGYCEVTGLQVTDGSFFSSSSWDMANRYAVLNEYAAFQLFGGDKVIGNTVMLDGVNFTVVGVVEQQKKKEAVVYVPSTTGTGTVQSMMVKTKAGSGAVLNGLNQLGVYESNCQLLDLESISLFFRQLLIVAVSLCILLGLILLTGWRLSALSGYYSRLKLRSQRLYFQQVLKESRKDLPGIGFQTATAAAGITLILYMARKVLIVVLDWKGIWKEFVLLSDNIFKTKLHWLIRIFYCGPVLFGIFLVAFLFICAAMIKSHMKRDSIA